jgi:hypothetical protein
MMFAFLGGNENNTSRTAPQIVGARTISKNKYCIFQERVYRNGRRGRKDFLVSL